VIKSRNVKCVGHEICIEKKRCKQILQPEISKERNHLKEIGLIEG
jgi:hypothetical protein